MYRCVTCRAGYTESSDPFLNNDVITCPHCKTDQRVVSRYHLTAVNAYALYRAKQDRFKLLRTDRGAIEYVATSRTPSKVWSGDAAAYVIGDVVFWPTEASSRSKRLLRHEVCHVNQSRRIGPITFAVKYALESLLRGYDHNRYEIEARRAERRRA